MASNQSKIIAFGFRHGKFLTNKKYTPQEMRARAEQGHWIFKVCKDVQITPVEAGSVSAEWVIPKNAIEQAAILYIHGGAWYMCSPRTHRGMVSYITNESSVRALSIDYRLAPEYPFPAALEDCMSAYEWLLEQGYPPDRIIVAGDSAGGNLTLALLVALKEAGKPLPSAAVALSPATDLTFKGESYATRLKSDPILIHVGENEVLLDDAVGFVKRAQAAGVDAQVKVWPGMFHVFQLFVPWLPEARQAVSEIGEFMRARIRAA